MSTPIKSSHRNSVHEFPTHQKPISEATKLCKAAHRATENLKHSLHASRECKISHNVKALHTASLHEIESFKQVGCVKNRINHLLLGEVGGFVPLSKEEKSDLQNAVESLSLAKRGAIDLLNLDMP